MLMKLFNLFVSKDSKTRNRTDSLKTKDRGLNFLKVYFHRVTVRGNRYEGIGISALLKEQSWETLGMGIVGYYFFLI